MKKIMKSMIGRLAAVFVLAVMGASLITPNTNAISVEQTIKNEMSTFAVNCEDQSFMVFGLRPWYSGLTDEVVDANNKTTCTLKKPDANGVPLQQYIWMIVLNILVDLFFLVGFALPASHSEIIDAALSRPIIFPNSSIKHPNAARMFRIFFAISD